MVVSHRIIRLKMSGIEYLSINIRGWTSTVLIWDLLPGGSKVESINPSAWARSSWGSEGCVSRMPMLFVLQESNIWHAGGWPQLQPLARGAAGGLCLGRGAAPRGIIRACDWPSHPGETGLAPAPGPAHRGLSQLYGLQHKHFMKWQSHPRHSQHPSQSGYSLCWTSSKSSGAKNLKLETVSC